MNKRLLFCLLPTLLLIQLLGVAQADTNKIDDSTANTIPLFLLGDGDGQGEQNQSQDISGLLQSSRDVYASIAGFNFSFARFRLRGYGGENTNILIGGIPANDPESGRAIWAYWGGLNDITRYPQVRTGLSPARDVFAGVGGYSNISLRASEKRKGTKFSYAATNRTYTNRVILTHNTGWLKNGWAFSASVSGRYSQEGYVEGTFFRGMSYFAAAEKRISDDYSINLAVFGAPTVQARQGIALKEAQELTENNYYNPYWGYQQGEKRNARLRNNHKPYIVVSDRWQINDRSTWSTSLYAVVGRTGNTNLNWYDAADPRPDYYKKLPSYELNQGNLFEGNLATFNWQNDVNTSQIDWDFLYFANSKNLYSQENADGIEGNTATGNRSKYIVEEYRTDPRQFGVNSVYHNKLSDHWQLSVGLNGSNYTSKNYKTMNDLLGGDFWVDVDQFAERDFADPNAAQNDLATPNKVIREGDVFGYNYDLHVLQAETFGNIDLKTARIDAYLSASLSGTQFWRTGNWQNGRFPDNSLGNSEKHTFYNYGLKAGAVYKITGRHMIAVNGANQTRAPYARNAFTSPRTRDQVVDGLENTKILSGDINYIVRYPKLKARVTGFYTEINDQVWSRSFYHDEYRNFVNYMMTGMDQLFRGVEVGVEGNITPSWVLSGAFTKAQYLYNSRPVATVTVDNSQEVLDTDKKVYLKNYRIGGMPQTAGSIGIKYNSPKYWFAGVNANYFADIYLDPNPDRRTEEALAGYVDTDPQVAEIIDQEKLENGFSLNLFAGKSWRIRKNGSYIRLNVNVSNILNNRDFITGGFEQLRYDAGDIDRFPSKYGYAYGLTYFGMLSYQF